MAQPEKQSAEENLWRAYGPEKEAWKAEGNVYPPEELARMEKNLSELKIKPRARRIYVVE